MLFISARSCDSGLNSQHSRYGLVLREFSYVYMLVCASVYGSVCLSVHLSVCPSTHLPTPPSDRPPLFLHGSPIELLLATDVRQRLLYCVAFGASLGGALNLFRGLLVEESSNVIVEGELEASREVQYFS